MNLSPAVAAILLAGKAFAAVVTGSSAIYSDAAESMVHVFEVAFAGWALRLSHKPANGIHVHTDVWSSLAVIAALLLIKATGWLWWDQVCAALAALNILRIGLGLIRGSLAGLLDEADPVIEQQARDLLDMETLARDLAYHNFRHRHSGLSHWVGFHLVFPDAMSVQQAHDEATAIEAAVAGIIAPVGRVITHLEPRSSEQRIESWEMP